MVVVRNDHTKAGKFFKKSVRKKVMGRVTKNNLNFGPSKTAHTLL